MVCDVVWINKKYDIIHSVTKEGVVFISLILFVVGFVILVRGADYFVAGTSAFASRMRISELMVGLTVVVFLGIYGMYLLQLI